MEFPISRTNLQRYRECKAVAADIKERVSEEIKVICKNVEATILNTYDNYYIYRVPSHVKYGSSGLSFTQQANIIKELMNSITNLFIDCKIIIDPLESYILIDWS